MRNSEVKIKVGIEYCVGIKLIETTSVLKDGRFSDLQVTSGDKTHQVHRVILGTQSKVFAAMVGGHFKVRSSIPAFEHTISAPHRIRLTTVLLISIQEAKTSQIELDDDEALVDCMFEYMYTGNFTAPEKGNFLGSLSQLHEIADKYDIIGLGDLAKAMFLERHIKITQTSNSTDSSSDSDAAKEELYIGFLESISIIYTQDSRSNYFKEKTSACYRRNAELLQSYSSERVRNAARAAVCENPAFAYDIVNRYIKDSSLKDRE